MSTAFPSALDNFTNPTASDYLDTVPHTAQHANINDAVEALEAKVGITNSAVTSSLDYKISYLLESGVYFNVVTDGGAIGNGSADDTAAFVAGMASAYNVIVVPQGVYKVTAPIAFDDNKVVLGIGLPEIAMNNSGDIFTAAGNENIIIDGLAFSVSISSLNGNIVDFDGCNRITLRNNYFTNSRDQALYIHACDQVSIQNNTFMDNGSTCMEMETCTNFLIDGNQMNGQAGFGVRMTGCNSGIVTNNITNDSALELIGIRYNCSNIQIVGNHAEGTGDNGISCTGKYCVIANNVCHDNAHDGIHIYGSTNSVTGNNCFNNGTAGAGYGGIVLSGGFGGNAINNSVTGNNLFNSAPGGTQSYGIVLGGNNYTLWATGVSKTADASTVYFGNNAYIAATSGTTGATAPVHTSGTVSDGGVSWTFLFTTTTSFQANNNSVIGNDYSNNATSPFSNIATAAINYAHVVGFLGVNCVPQTVLHTYLDNTSTAASCTFEQDGSGDASFQFLLTGTRAWLMGIDNSDADKFKFCPANDGFASTTVALGTNGDVQLFGTITAGGTTGAQTINKPCGSVNLAAAATSLVVTNSLVTSSSIVTVQLQSNDTTMNYARVEVGSGSFTIRPDVAPTSEARVSFIVINTV